MRITFACAGADLTGGFRVIATLAAGLRRRGHDVVVLSRAPRPPNWRDVLRALYRRQPRPHVGPTHLDGSSVPHRVLPHDRTPRAEDFPDADVVFATWWETAEWIVRLPIEKGVPIHLLQDYEVWNGSVDRVDAVCRLAMPKITSSAWMKELLAEKFDRTNVWLMPNGVDFETFRAAPRDRQSSATVGFTYSPLALKGCDIAAEAIRLAREKRALRVVAFGSGAPTHAIPLPPQTEFRLRVPDEELRTIYARCDAWLFPTRREGFGLPLLEAMACRTPVIAAGAGAAPQLLAQGGGKLLPIGDAQAMADAIEAICTMPPSEWRRLSDEAYAIARRHSWDAAIDAFEAAMREAIAWKP